MPRSGSVVRVFRADTTVDVWCAAITQAVLGEAPAVLAYSRDKSGAERDAYEAAMQLAASAHPWDAIIDISDLPMNAHWFDRFDSKRSLRRLLDTRRSVRRLRRQVTTAVDGVAPDARLELYVTCLTHPDIRAFVHALSDEDRAHYYPHSFLSLNGWELDSYEPYAIAYPARPPTHWRARMKRVVLGHSGVVPNVIRVDRAVTFEMSPPWARETIQLAAHPREIAGLVDRVPAAVRDELQRLRTTCRQPIGLLTIGPEEWDESYPLWMELQGTAELVAAVSAAESLGSILLKPHPRSSPDWVDRLTEAVRSAVPSVDLHVMKDLAGLPAEIIAPHLEVAAVAGVASTSLITLARLFGVHAYCAERLALQLYGVTPNSERLIGDWLDEHRSTWRVVSLSTDDLHRSTPDPGVTSLRDT